MNAQCRSRLLWCTSLLAAAGVCAAQGTRVNLRAQAREVDFSAASMTKPVRAGGALPATCSTGEMFFHTAVAQGQNLFLCIATNTWSGISAAEGASYLAGAGISIAGQQISVEDAYVPVYYTGNGAPALPCQAGRDYYLDKLAKRFYVCGGTDQWAALANGQHSHTPGEVVEPDAVDNYWLLPQGYFSAGAVAAVNPGAANRVYLWKFYLPIALAVNRIVFEVVTGAAGASCNVGLYNRDGTQRLADTGAVDAAAPGTKTITLAAASSLSAGYYTMAWGCTSTAVEVRAAGSGAEENVSNGAGHTVIGHAANSISGGALPAATGGIVSGSPLPALLVKLVK